MHFPRCPGAVHCLHARQPGPQPRHPPRPQRQAPAVAAGQGATGRVPGHVRSTLEAQAVLSLSLTHTDARY